MVAINELRRANRSSPPAAGAPRARFRWHDIMEHSCFDGAGPSEGSGDAGIARTALTSFRGNTVAQPCEAQGARCGPGYARRLVGARWGTHLTG